MTKPKEQKAGHRCTRNHIHATPEGAKGCAGLGEILATERTTPKALDAIADAVLAYRPKARSEPARQRKRRKTILEKKRAKKA